MIVICCILSVLVKEARSLYLNQMISTANQFYCPTGSSPHGWLFYRNPEGLSVTSPDPLKIKKSDREATLQFCEAHDGLTNRLPRGDYCLFKGRSSCPKHFDEQSFSIDSGEIERSSAFGSTSMCCSSFLADPVTMPFQPPFVLIRKNDKCQRVANTKVTEIILRTAETLTEVLNLCYYEVSPCSDRNGGCDQVCSHEDNSVHCSCYHGYQWDDNTNTCEIDTTLFAVVTEPPPNHITNSSVEKMTARLKNQNPALFSTNNEIVAMVTGAAVMLGLLLLLFAILLYCHKITCNSTCYKRGYFRMEKRATITTPAQYRTPSTGGQSTHSRRISAISLNRNSISGPLLNANVAVDLLNRPKHQIVPMHDVSHAVSTPSLLRPNSYYANQDRYSVHSGMSNTAMSTTRESIYDSLDRRRKNQVANIQYAEPNNISRSTATITNDDMYYCQPDESLMNQTEPETPVPGYASQPETPVYAQPDPETPLPEYPETPVPVYHNAEVGFTFAEYQDPATKFSHGTLGRRWTDTSSGSDRSGSASVARIAPIVRDPSANIHSNNALK